MSELTHTKMFWLAAFSAFVSGCMSYGFPVFVNGLLVKDKGLDPVLANLVASVTFFVTIFGSPLGGIISDNIFKGSRWQTVALGNILITVMLLIVAFTNGIVLAISMILAYMFSSICLGPYWAIPAELGHPSIATESAGIINVFGNTGGFTIGFILTALASWTGSFLICLYVCAVLAALSAVGISFVRR
jgi:nitrate/nitrite transporter NarK